MNSFFQQLLNETPATLQLLEVGGGTGATLERILERLKATPLESLRYTIVEGRSDNLARAKRRILEWIAQSEYDATEKGSQIRLNGKQEGGAMGEAVITFEQADFFEFLTRRGHEIYDAVIAQALLDQVDLVRAVQQLNPALQEGGLWYLPIHFDGLTAFEPTIDAELDQKIMDLYDESIPHTNSGRQLLNVLPELGSKLIDVGSSDWIVFSTQNGYENDEAYFLKCILSFIRDEIVDRPDISSSLVSEWVDERWTQLESEELIFMTHQLDICAEKT